MTASTWEQLVVSPVPRQQILTIKSDDVAGRSKAYEAIVKGEPMPQPGIPESLNVLLHELRGFGLSIELD